jgi:hypothetical protein
MVIAPPGSGRSRGSPANGALISAVGHMICGKTVRVIPRHE